MVCASGAWRADIHLHRNADCQLLAEAAATGPIQCVVGDIHEVTGGASQPPHVNALAVTLDFQISVVRGTTSLTGLPPVFVFRDGRRTSLSCPFIPEEARGSLEPDPDGIADFLRWGHPIDGRTLFLKLSAIASNSSFVISAGGDLTIHTSLPWPTSSFASLTREEIVREQVTAFAQSASRFAAQDAFLSLSGGLDSRAALVALLSHRQEVPCVTMAGSRENLDARLAAAYCQAQGIPHYTVLLDQVFEQRVPELLGQTADLSGGVACLSQTVDLYLYESLPAPFTARISGNLGNQVGRGGVESLSVYQPKTEVFSETIRDRLATRPLSPWFIPRLAEQDYGEALFGQEVHFWSIPNYVVGSSRALQLTPYADQRLLLLSRAAFSLDSELHPASREILRKRDVRHRMTGTPRESSFQRQFIAEHDRRGREVPLNWGWRAPGGSSFRWRLSALASATDAALTKIRGQSSRLRPFAQWASSRLGHRSSLVDWPGLIKGRLRELVMDAVASQHVRHAGVFNANALDSMMRRHFDGSEDSHQTVARVAELALGICARANRPI